MLVHICCSVDSHYYLARLLEEFAGERIVGFFFNPNIHPQAEFELRYADVARSCARLGIELVRGEYDPRGWLAGAAALAGEPERGARCEFCFDYRMRVAAQMAVARGCSRLTTTLLMSPKKSLSQLGAALLAAADERGLAAIVRDYRKNGGTNAQMRAAFEAHLYHQNYCGCFHALHNENAGGASVNGRGTSAGGANLGAKNGEGGAANSNLSADGANSRAAGANSNNPTSNSTPKFTADPRLFSPISRQVLPASVEQRTAVFAQVGELERAGAAFELARNKILNYRLLRAFVRFCPQSEPNSNLAQNDGDFGANLAQNSQNLARNFTQNYSQNNAKILPSHVVFYSLAARETTKFALSNEQIFAKNGAKKDVVFLQKDGVVLLTARKFCKLAAAAQNSAQSAWKMARNLAQNQSQNAWESAPQTARELAQNPPPVAAEIAVRRGLCGEFSLSPIIVLDELAAGRYEVFLQSEIFVDFETKILLN